VYYGDIGYARQLFNPESFIEVNRKNWIEVSKNIIKHSGDNEWINGIVGKSMFKDGVIPKILDLNEMENPDPVYVEMAGILRGVL